MMKKVLLSLLLLVVTGLTAVAQETAIASAIHLAETNDGQEITATPRIMVYEIENDVTCVMTITNSDEDPEATIFFAIDEGNSGLDYWMVYDGMPCMFSDPGCYTIFAYAQSDGKQPSDVVCFTFVVNSLRVIAPFIHPVGKSSTNSLELKLIPDPAFTGAISTVEPAPYPFVNAEAFDYCINGGELNSTGPNGGTITLDGYGHYTIEAYGRANGYENSYYVTATIDIDATGYTTLCDNILVHDGIIYDVESDNTLALSSPWSTTRPGFSLYYHDDIVIPATISFEGTTYTVTGIKEGAFSQPFNFVLGVHLPSTISHIDGNPFGDCPYIYSIIVDEANPYYDSREGCNAIIESETNTLIAGCNNTIVPNTIEAIGDYAFKNCQDIKVMYLPQSVTRIGTCAFMGCYGLQTIVCKAVTPPSTDYVFDSSMMVYPDITLYVPEDGIQDYWSHEFWCMFNIYPMPSFKPLVLFDESDNSLTIYVFTNDYSEVTVDGKSMGCQGSLIYTIPRRTSDDFHVLVYILSKHQAFYFGYDSRYDTFTTLPMLYASEAESGKGLKINVRADLYDYYELYFWSPGFEYVWPEYCDYQINGSGEWTRSTIGDSFYLPQYGDYTIQAYGFASGDKCCNSGTIIVDVHYGPDGFYSRCNNHIVYNGLYYSPNSEQNENTLMVHLNYYDDGSEFSLPTLSDIVIPGSFTIAGDEYIVTEVNRNSLNDAGSITCLSATPISAWLNYNIENDPLFEQTTLYVPLDGLEAYKADPEWGLFTHIVPFIGVGPGDVDGDGTVGIDDVTILIDQLLNGGELPAWFDVDGDDTVDINDVTTLIDKLLSGKY